LSFQAGNILYKRATPTDDSALQSVLRQNPIEGWVRLSMQRAPTYFAGENLMGQSVPVLACDQAANGQALGMYDCAFPPVWINGAAEHAGYLGGLRVNPDYRRRPAILKNGFASIPILLQDETAEIPVWFTSIADDNRVARRVLEAGLNGMPRYQRAGELETLVISTRQARPGSLLRQATPADITRLVELHGSYAARYQFAPRLSENWLCGLCGTNGLRLEDFWLLEERGRVVACVALWDQRAFKQTVIHGYRFPLNYLRGALNLAAAIGGRPALPPAGACLKSIFLSFFACTPTVSGNTIVAMIREVLWLIKRRQCGLGLIGLSTQNPLLSGLRSSLRSIVYRTCIEQVTLHGAQTFTLDQRPPQPEIAVL